MDFARAADDALLIELGEVTAQELHAFAVAARSLDGVIACIPGHSSLYVVCDPPKSARARGDLEKKLPSLASTSIDDAATPGTRIVRVSFAESPDLDEFLARQSLSIDAFLDRVSALRFTARYLGFRGGFAYLDGWPPEWAMPRRPTSRPHVPRGTFAIAGDVAGFYPIDSPGGWNLLGRTEANLEYAIAQGDVLAIEPTLDPLPAVSPHARRNDPLRLEAADILAAPLARLVTAPDWSGIECGRPPGGPFDDMAAAIASRAVTRCETLIECAMTGPRLRFRRRAVAAWCGPDLQARAHRMEAGEELAIGRIDGGLRGYLAIGAGEGVTSRIERDDRRVIRVARGPHPSDLEAIECRVTPQLDRVGVRLRPTTPVHGEAPSDLRSCGMQRGTIQIHPDGSIVAMGPDHPITGGYLQPLTVLSSERWKLGQLVPEETVRLVVDDSLRR